MSWESLIAPFTEAALPWFSTPLAIFAAWLMGFSRSGLGAGGFVVSPLMVLALGSKDGLGIIAALMIPAGIMGCWQYRQTVDTKMLKALVPGAFIGTLGGSLTLWAIIASGEKTEVDQRLGYLVAGLSLLYVILVSFRRRIANWGNPPGSPQIPGMTTIGSLVGFSQTVANSGAPLITIYFLRHGLKKELFVPAQIYFLMVQNSVKLIPFILLGVIHPGNAGAALLLFPLTLIGSGCGKIFEKFSNEKTFFALYVSLLTIGFLSSATLLWGRENFLNLLK